MDRANLSEEQTLSEIETEVRNLVISLDDFGRRTKTMLDTLTLAHELTETTVTRYRDGGVGLSDLMQAGHVLRLRSGTAIGRSVQDRGRQVTGAPKGTPYVRRRDRT